jgi:hypothetical protein
MIGKNKLLEYFKLNGRVRVVTPSHKYYGIDRKAEKIQTNSVRLEGGSWLYFKSIKAITRQGFSIDNCSGGFIDYAFMNMEIIKELE